MAKKQNNGLDIPWICQIVILCGLCWIGWGSAKTRLAMAYVPPAKAILTKVIRNLNLETPYRARHQIVCFSDHGNNDSDYLSETVYYKMPDLVRSEIRTRGIHRIRVSSLDQTLIIRNGKRVSEGETLFDLHTAFLVCRSMKSILGFLKSRGVDLAIVSLGRLGSRPVYVIGAKYPDVSKPQVHVDKETFVPVRQIYSWPDPFPILKKHGHRRIDVRFSKWARINRVRYPMAIQVYLDEMPVADIFVQDVRKGLEISEDLLDPGYIRSMYPYPVYVSDESADFNSAMFQVMKGIEDFEQLFKRDP